MTGFPQVFECAGDDSLWSKNVGGVRQNIHLATQGGLYQNRTSTNAFSCGGSAGSTTQTGEIPKVLGTDGYFYPKEGVWPQVGGGSYTITYVY
jgi:hypothetical protein